MNLIDLKTFLLENNVSVLGVRENTELFFGIRGKVNYLYIFITVHDDDIIQINVFKGFSDKYDYQFLVNDLETCLKTIQRFQKEVDVL